jgi:hypothetical protein
MLLNKSTAVVDYKLVTAFETLQARLLDEKYADRHDKPLAYWTVATDRRLPLAFMGRSLKDLLNTPFDELFSTAGIGQKKIRTFLMLLKRAAQAKPIGALVNVEEEIPDAAAETARKQPGVVDASIVSEALWVRWRASIRKHGFEQEPLGRFAESLFDMPHVIWYRPLGDYTDLTLADLRSLRTHGEKRVSAVVEVFGNLHRILMHLDADRGLAVRVVPRFLIPIENWTLCWLANVEIPSKKEIRQSLISPLLDQVRIDAGPEIHRLAKSRIESQSRSVREAADRLGLTRARIYQLLSEVAEVVTLRWPAGPALVGQLRAKMQLAGADQALLAWFDSAIELLFVRNARGENDAHPSDSHRNGSANGNGSSEPANGYHGRRAGAKASPRRSQPHP